MCTKSEVLEQCPWVELRLASSSPAWSSPRPQHADHRGQVRGDAPRVSPRGR